MRALKLALTARRKPRTGLTDEIVTPMIAWPRDIDLFMKINKGRYLTLMDISRLEFCYQIGVMPAVKGRGWGFAVAGSSIRYRKRIGTLQRFAIHARLAGIDDRWIYFQHTIKRRGVWHVSALVRTAVIDRKGAVPTAILGEELGLTWDAELPDWVQRWDECGRMRPWGDSQAANFLPEWSDSRH